MTRVNIIKGLGPYADCRRLGVELPKAMHDQLDAHQLHLAHHLVCAAPDR